MNALKPLLLSGLLISLSAPALSASAVQEAANTCKAVAALEFSAESPVRVKFRNLSGPRKEKTVRLRVLPEEGDSFEALCRINPVSLEVISLTRS